MFTSAPFYHGIIRKVIVGFGRLFSDVKIPRYDTEGNLVQIVDVPIAWGPKEKWMLRNESDPSLNNTTYTVLPRMSFEITGFQYDPERSLNKMNTIYCVNATDGTRKQAFTPAPYNLDISLYVMTKTTEDALALVEQILPFFRPEYTLAIKTVPELNIIADTPIILNDVINDDQYEGDMETRRTITYTFTFTAKVNLLGPVSPVGLIKSASANIVNMQEYNASQATPTSEILESWKLLDE